MSLRWLALFSQICLVVNGSNAAVPVQRQYKLYHDFGHGFVERNSMITLTANDNSLSASIIENACSTTSSTNGEEEVDGGGETTTTTCSNPESSSSSHNNNNSVSEDAVFALMKQGGFYKLKAVDVKTGVGVMTSVSPCELKKANYRERITMVLSSTADLLALEYTPLVSPLMAKASCRRLLADAPDNGDNGDALLIRFNSTVSYSSSTPATTIPLKLSSPMTVPRGGLKVLPRDKNSDTSGNSDLGVNEETTNMSQSFLVKYWYVVLPIFLIVVLGTEEAPPPDAGAGAGGLVAAATAGAVAAAGGGGANPGMGGQKARRGKRG